MNPTKDMKIFMRLNNSVKSSHFTELDALIY